MSGWRRGLFVSALSLVGLVFGAWLGKTLIEILSGASTETSLIRTGLSAATLFIGIGIGSAIGGLGRQRHRHRRWPGKHERFAPCVDGQPRRPAHGQLEYGGLHDR